MYTEGSLPEKIRPTTTGSINGEELASNKASIKIRLLKDKLKNVNR